MHDRHFGKTVVIALGIAAAPLASACSNGDGGKEPPLSPTSEISIPTSPVETTSPLPGGADPNRTERQQREPTGDTADDNPVGR
ncbi:hypothetical protein MMAG44476_35981 [Mycolicibacterium mageritense DSM 44476 = CIP 104973]|uniref:Lipoprotein n=1 Tax=Mycolicibacterium mageritense TaxID=53462 RepID=A0ABM7HPB3_MYCME|nr:hypothetical protein [Mycolicibacterium mageritense]MCC9180620.1 hypothetical protein [Mycolicibacterium mageritense]BBX32370.1 hypothetical protein MMAGJ_16520 [Mycolicibacterium mageritense]GJJ20675.1 hypothetical protein MTY414_43480 [Mycolicibacterium mageritense]CDO23087.1 hypothetical protein BN978_03566 [Mycolicibacterium mageritense DSM 44476 = CIP 104973]